MRDADGVDHEKQRDRLDKLASLIEGELDVGYGDGDEHEFAVPSSVGVPAGPGTIESIDRDVSDMSVEEAFAAGYFFGRYTLEYGQ